MVNNNRNEYVASEKLQVPGLETALQNLKAEIATELGLYNYEQMDKGDLTARQNGQIGGLMTKRLVEIGQMALAQQDEEKMNNKLYH